MSGKITFIYSQSREELGGRFLRERMSGELPPESLLYLVGSQARAQALKERFLLTREDAAAPDRPFLTEERFLTLLVEKSLLPARLLKNSRRLMLLQQIILQKRAELGYFRYRDQGVPPAVLGGLLRFFDDLRLADAGQLLRESARVSPPGTGEGSLSHDLSLILGEYLRYLNAGFLDPAGLLRQLTGRINPETLAAAFPRLRTLAWEDVSHFKPLHFAFIRKLSQLGIDLVLMLPYGENPEIFRHKRALFTELRARADEVIHRADTAEPVALFRMTTGPGTLPAGLAIFPAIDRRREVERLAGEIKRLVVERDWRYARIAVTAPVLANYRALLETVFRRYGIPFTFNEPQPLHQSLVIQQLLLGFQMIREQYPLSIIRKLLQSPFYSYGERLRTSAYKQVLRELRVRSGRKAVAEMLRRERDYRKRLPAEDENRRDVAVYDQLLSVLKELFNDWDFFTHSHSAAELYHYLVIFLEKHFLRQFAGAPEFRENRLILEDNFTAVRRFMDALFDWKNIVERQSPGRRFGPAEIHTILSTLFQSESYSRRLPRQWGVQIVPLWQVRDLPFSALFVLGMEEGAFPRPGRSPFAHPGSLPEGLRRFLPDNSLFEDRELFQELLQHPAGLVQFSYPQYQEDRPVLPSVFLRELRRVAGRDLVAERPVRLFSLSDVLAELVRRQPPESPLSPAPLPAHLRGGQTDSLIAQFSFRRSVALRRHRNESPGKWEGNLQREPVVAAWLTEFYRERPFSVTQLERYAGCPLYFFFERILRVAPPETGSETLTPLDRGGLVHRALFRFYREQAASARTLPALLKIAEEEFGRIPIPRNILWQVEKERYLGGPRRQGLLPAFFAYEQQALARYRTVPRHFEFSFGEAGDREEIDPESVTAPYRTRAGGETLLFRGKIDRIEISPEGDLLIVDYKTGAQYPGMRQLLAGESLQLPIYLKIAGELLAQKYPALYPAGGAYYQLRNEAKIEKKVVFVAGQATVAENLSPNSWLPNDSYRDDTGELTVERLVETSLGYAARYIRGIRAGDFVYTAESGHCRSGRDAVCPYQSLCRRVPSKQHWLRMLAGGANTDGKEETPDSGNNSSVG